jgi:hypothetical protein
MYQYQENDESSGAKPPHNRVHRKQRSDFLNSENSFDQEEVDEWIRVSQDKENKEIKWAID